MTCSDRSTKKYIAHDFVEVFVPNRIKSEKGEGLPLKFELYAGLNYI